MHRILAEKSVNITELRKNPAKYFIDQPVAVLSNNRPAGYLLSASAFEALMDMLAEQEEKKPIKARFRPSAAREGANKWGNSSRLTQSFHFFMFEPIFSPVNALNQPI